MLLRWFRKEMPEEIRQRDLLEAQTLLLEYQKNVEWFAAMSTAMQNRIHRLQRGKVTYYENIEKGLKAYAAQTQQN